MRLHLATSAALEAFQEDPPCLLDPAPKPCPVEARAVLRFLTAPDHPVYFARSGYHARFSLMDPTSPDSASVSFGKLGKVSFGMGSLSFVGPPFMAEIYMPVQYLLAPAP